jgi:hypothetical protein
LYLPLNFNVTLLALTRDDEVGVVSGTCEDEKRMWMIVVWTPEGRKPHEIHRRKWEYNIKM